MRRVREEAHPAFHRRGDGLPALLGEGDREAGAGGLGATGAENNMKQAEEERKEQRLF